ncbi:unnamed protein product [Knipowitschia caucasica]|uniref:Transcription factor Adf-1 n=1 Tax=Knipowitschia caucasica TaxID=637954 RepID=A0AAV2J0M1_KNICA
MEDKLILSVFNFPELYNATLPNYRCTQSRAAAWKSISLTLGLPTDECKKKWKNMRDRYLKEVRLEVKSRSLLSEPVQSRWRYRQLMNFIAPFTGSRVSLNDMCPEDEPENQDPEPGSAQGLTGTADTIKTPRSGAKAIPHTDTKPRIASVPQDPQASKISSSISPIVNKPGRKRRYAQPERRTSAAADQGAPETSDTTRDEDQLFLLSFVPALKRLAPQKRCETKMRIQQLLYEAEFNVCEAEREAQD